VALRVGVCKTTTRREGGREGGREGSVLCWRVRKYDGKVIAYYCLRWEREKEERSWKKERGAEMRKKRRYNTKEEGTRRVSANRQHERKKRKMYGKSKLDGVCIFILSFLSFCL